VMIPIGSSAGGMTSRATMSTTTSSSAPSNAEAGRRKVCAGLDLAYTYNRTEDNTALRVLPDTESLYLSHSPSHEPPARFAVAAE
jgi:hypothetical protein